MSAATIILQSALDAIEDAKDALQKQQEVLDGLNAEAIELQRQIDYHDKRGDSANKNIVISQLASKNSQINAAETLLTTKKTALKTAYGNFDRLYAKYGKEPGASEIKAVVDQTKEPDSFFKKNWKKITILVVVVVVLIIIGIIIYRKFIKKKNG